MLKPDTAPSNKGILNAESGMRSFSLSRLLPGQDLAPYIEHLWILRWDLRGQAPHSQTVLSFPSIQLAFERTGQRIETFLYGVPDTTFTRVLEGEGQVLGVKFRIGGFYPFWNQPVSSLTNQVIPFREIFGSGPGMLEERLFSEAKEEEQAWIAWEFLRERLPEPDGNVELVNRIVAAIIGDREMVRVEDIVSLFGINKRTLQRLFSRYVGVSPKWVIQRYRLQEAAELMEKGSVTDWTRLSQDLGYYDQAHFIKDFKTMIGQPPEEYVRNVRHR